MKHQIYVKLIFIGLSVLGMTTFLFPLFHIDGVRDFNGFEMFFGERVQVGHTDMRVINVLGMMLFHVVHLAMFVFSIISLGETYLPKTAHLLVFGIYGIMTDIIVQVYVCHEENSMRISGDSSIDWGAASSWLEISFGMYLSYSVYIAVIVLGIVFNRKIMIIFDKKIKNT
jgi:hypothetical protein